MDGHPTLASATPTGSGGGRECISTGVPGLDEILCGGLTAHRVYLVEGQPGTGKTTLALQFLLEGVRSSESGLYITLSETAEELSGVAQSHGWQLDGVNLFELSESDDTLLGDEQTLLHPWEFELGRTVDLIFDKVEAVQPRRIVFDSLSEMRLMAQDPLRYRRQLLALKQYFAGRQATVILIDDLSGPAGGRDSHLHSLCHGVITLERQTPLVGATRSRLQVQKLRGVAFRVGYHDFAIRQGGLQIFPRMVASDAFVDGVAAPMPSGLAELDALLGGGPARGATTLITGPAGSGKTTLGLQYLLAACERNERCTLYEFDERVDTLLSRAAALSMDMRAHLSSGLLRIVPCHAAELSLGEFAAMVRHEVEQRGVRVLMIDSLRGFLTTIGQDQLALQLHELLSYLSQHGVTIFLVNPQRGLMETNTLDGTNISYIADVVVLLRFFEADGRIRKALSVLKNRGGAHEDAIRELRFDTRGIRLGQALTEFRGVLTGTPTYVGSRDPLMEDRDDAA